MTSKLTNLAVHRDVEHIQPLTKTDLQEFYRAYIHPSSATRAKASIHLIAQGKSPAAASSISQALAQLPGGTTVDETALSQSLSKLDLNADTDSKSVLAAVTSYLRDSVGVAEEQIKALAEQGEGILQQILPSLNLTSSTAPAKEAETNGHFANGDKKVNGNDEKEEKKPILIEDVRAWKASLPASQGPRMVKDLSEFEDFEPKL
jgi:insulysin